MFLLKTVLLISTLAGIRKDSLLVAKQRNQPLSVLKTIQLRLDR